MRYGIDENGNKIEVTKSGQQAKCTDCESILIGRYGEFRVPHWSHKQKFDCDSWSEPITAWHLSWQNYFPLENREVQLIDKLTGIKHRADIKLNNGLVIEVQHSSIKPEEIRAREQFYGINNMLWIIDGSNLAAHSSVRYRFIKKGFNLYLGIPDYSEYYPKYDMDEFRFEIYQSDFYKYVRGLETFKDDDIQNGNALYFSFTDDPGFNEVEETLIIALREICNSLYGNNAYNLMRNEFTIEIYCERKDEFRNIYLTKKYWRSFIDHMQFPVFIDLLPGLESDLLYWYQKNKIVTKESFIKHYKH